MKKNQAKGRKRKGTCRYLVMIRGTDTGYSVDVPDVPGCITVAKTVPTARKMIAEALGYHFEVMLEHGETIPLPRKAIEFEVDQEETAEEFCTWVDVQMPKAVSSRS